MTTKTHTDYYSHENYVGAHFFPPQIKRITKEEEAFGFFCLTFLLKKLKKSAPSKIGQGAKAPFVGSVVGLFYELFFNGKKTHMWITKDTDRYTVASVAGRLPLEAGEGAVEKGGMWDFRISIDPYVVFFKVEDRDRHFIKKYEVSTKKIYADFLAAKIKKVVKKETINKTKEPAIAPVFAFQQKKEITPTEKAFALFCLSQFFKKLKIAAPKIEEDTHRAYVSLAHIWTFGWHCFYEGTAAKKWYDAEQLVLKKRNHPNKIYSVTLRGALPNGEPFDIFWTAEKLTFQIKKNTKTTEWTEPTEKAYAAFLVADKKTTKTKKTSPKNATAKPKTINSKKIKPMATKKKTAKRKPSTSKIINKRSKVVITTLVKETKKKIDAMGKTLKKRLSGAPQKKKKI